MADKKKVLKKTRGYSLSPENVMELQAEAWNRTMALKGGTVSPSAVLDEILTAWRKGRARSRKMVETLKTVRAA